MQTLALAPRPGRYELAAPQTPAGGFRGRLSGYVGFRRVRRRQRPALGDQPDIELVLSESGQIADRKFGPLGTAAAPFRAQPPLETSSSARHPQWRIYTKCNDRVSQTH